jgi:hypothetical protein
MQNCTIFKQHEAIDGLNLNVMLPLGHNFQVGGQWMLSNQKGASFEVTSSVNSSSGNPYQNPDEVQSAVLRFASDQTGMAMGNFNLPYGLILQSQTMFNDPECKQVMNLISLQKDFRDCSVTLRLQSMNGQNAYTGTWMQSINKAF